MRTEYVRRSFAISKSDKKKITSKTSVHSVLNVNSRHNLQLEHGIFINRYFSFFFHCCRPF